MAPGRRHLCPQHLGSACCLARSLILRRVCPRCDLLCRPVVCAHTPCQHPPHEQLLRSYAADGLPALSYASQLRSLPADEQRSLSGALWLGWATHMFLPLASALPLGDATLSALLRSVESRRSNLRDLVDLRSWPPTLLGHIKNCTRERTDAYFRGFAVDFTYESNRIEGSTLSLRQTQELARPFFWKWTPTPAPVPDFIPRHQRANALAALDHLAAWQYVQSTLQQADLGTLTLSAILELHQRAMARSLVSYFGTSSAGRWRDLDVSVSGTHLVAPVHEEVPAVMAKLMEWMHEHAESVWHTAVGSSSPSPSSSSTVSSHPVVFAAMVHLYFVNVHPFEDGNGRVARLLMNQVLMHHGYPPINIRARDRELLPYFQGLQQGQPQVGGAAADFKPFLRFVAAKMERTLARLHKELMSDRESCADRGVVQPTPLQGQ